MTLTAQELTDQLSLSRQQARTISETALHMFATIQCSNDPCLEQVNDPIDKSQEFQDAMLRDATKWCDGYDKVWAQIENLREHLIEFGVDPGDDTYVDCSQSSPLVARIAFELAVYRLYWAFRNNSEELQALECKASKFVPPPLKVNRVSETLAEMYLNDLRQRQTRIGVDYTKVFARYPETLGLSFSDSLLNQVVTEHKLRESIRERLNETRTTADNASQQLVASQ